MSSLPRPRVLVVEDNPANLMLVQAALRQSFDVDAAGDAEAALAQIDRARPDVILMDIGLPGKDGLTLTAELTARPGFAVPIVILTAHAMQSDRDAADAAGAVGFITKPISPRALPEQLRAFLQTPR